LDESLARLSEVIITPQILERQARPYTHEFDDVYQNLLNQVEAGDDAAMQAICDAALKYCHAESAGLSLLDYVNDKPVFNWVVGSGETVAMVGKIFSPRDNTPCGTTLEMYSYQVFRHPERHYRWVKENGFVVPEMIVVPIYKSDMQSVGTFWLMHAEGNHFDKEDIRIISMLLTLINKVLGKEDLRSMPAFP
jgi:hypothetical protein